MGACFRNGILRDKNTGLPKKSLLLEELRAERTGEAFSNAAIVQKDALHPIVHTLFQLQKINKLI